MKLFWETNQLVNVNPSNNNNKNITIMLKKSLNRDNKRKRSSFPLDKSHFRNLKRGWILNLKKMILIYQIISI